MKNIKLNFVYDEETEHLAKLEQKLCILLHVYRREILAAIDEMRAECEKVHNGEISPEEYNKEMDEEAEEFFRKYGYPEFPRTLKELAFSKP